MRAAVSMRLLKTVAFVSLAVLAACQDSGEERVASCDGCECEDYCVALCERVEAECGGTSLGRCSQGCFRFLPTVCRVDTVEARDCSYLEEEAECYEAFASENGDCTRPHMPPGVCEADYDCAYDGTVCEVESNLCL
jgi:hypothetical protein